MASKISEEIIIRPLYGNHEGEPMSTLLIIRGFHILLDCGWDESFDLDIIEPLREIAPKIHMVIISHAKIEKMGALVYAIKHFGLSAQSLGTHPVARLGRVVMQDIINSHAKVANFDLFTNEEIETYFGEECFNRRAFGERSDFDIDMGDGEIMKLVFSPFPAGHTLGGAIWCIEHETDRVIYAPDFNIPKDSHYLPQVAFLKDSTLFNRATVFITNGRNFEVNPPTLLPRQGRKSMMKLMPIISQRLRGNGPNSPPGNVLMPVECGGRMLEILILLDSYWKDSFLSHPLILLCPEAEGVKAVSYSSIHWMSDRVINSFNQNRDNRFKLEKFSICTSMSEALSIQRRPPYNGAPMVVVTTSSTLEDNLGSQMFQHWCGNNNNTLIFTQRVYQESVGKELLDELLRGETPQQTIITTKKWDRVPLEGEELEAYEEHQRQIEEMQKEREQNEKKGDFSGTVEEEDPLAKATEEISKTFVPRLPFPFCESGLHFSHHQVPTMWDPTGYQLNNSFFMNRINIDDEEDEETEDTLNRLFTRHRNTEDDGPPSKGVSKIVDLTVKMDRLFINMESQSGYKEAKPLFEKICPNSLFLLQTDGVVPKHMEMMSIKNMKALQAGDCVSILSSTAGQVHHVTIQPDILATQQKSGSVLIGPVVGRLEKENNDGNIVLKSEKNDFNPCATGPSMFVRSKDWALRNLLILLKDNGIPAKFENHSLVCGHDGNFIVSRKDGRFQIEGMLSASYFNIRKIIYEQFVEIPSYNPLKACGCGGHNNGIDTINNEEDMSGVKVTVTSLKAEEDNDDGDEEDIEEGANDNNEYVDIDNNNNRVIDEDSLDAAQRALMESLAKAKAAKSVGNDHEEEDIQIDLGDDNDDNDDEMAVDGDIQLDLAGGAFTDDEDDML
eukprot:TRINITY_DN5511_c1_g1_i1.p1 TRINITY_DN5511_c1_g1~~TRINITY_DN5511_c1_g1_i1.p1  ORF type:complete len:898 (-),score=277.75 TRINITY_DN5511_c1_g1_i1:171-2864(-)